MSAGQTPRPAGLGRGGGHDAGGRDRAVTYVDMDSQVHFIDVVALLQWVYGRVEQGRRVRP
jgi:hypothetical protein